MLSKMSRYVIRAEPDQVVVEFLPVLKLRSVLVFTLGVSALVTEMVVTYPHHNDGFVRFPGDFLDPRMAWRDWFVKSVLFLCAVVLLAVIDRSWLRVSREEMRFTPGELTYRRAPTWFFRTKRYEIRRIRWPYLTYGGQLEFVYDDQTVTIHAGMTGDEAKQIIDAVLRQLPQLAPIWGRCSEPTMDSNPYLSYGQR